MPVGAVILNFIKKKLTFVHSPVIRLRGEGMVVAVVAEFWCRK